MSAPQGGAASSFTDLMASLAAIFILLFVAAQNNRGVGVVNTRDALIKSLHGELASAASIDTVPGDPSTILVVFPDSLLFDRGSAQMKDGGRKVVTSTTPGLARVLCDSSRRKLLDQVVVEGHTDTKWPDAVRVAADGRRYNLVLSQRRSMDYVGVSTKVLADSSYDAFLSCYLRLVSASGRGQEDTLPVAGDSAAQRRVVLRIRLRTEVRDTVAANGNLFRSGR